MTRRSRFAEFLYIAPASELIKQHKRDFGYATLSLFLIFFVAGGNLQFLFETLFNDLLGLNFMWTQDMMFPGSDTLFSLLGFAGLWAVLVRLSKLLSVKVAAIRSVLILLGFVAVGHMSRVIYAAEMTFFFNNPFATPIILIASLALYIMLAISLRRDKFDLSAAKYGFWALMVWWAIVVLLVTPVTVFVLVIVFVEEMVSLDTPLIWLIVMIYQTTIVIGQHILLTAVAIAAQDKAIRNEQLEANI